MKKNVVFLLLILLVALSSTACAVRVPDSSETRERLEALGYTVEINSMSESSLADYKKKQIVVLTAENDGEFSLQAYFFQDKEDTNRFYKEHQSSLIKNVECFQKYGYSIFRGTRQAIRDAFGEDI